MSARKIQVKDITDEMVYAAIRKCRAHSEAMYARYITDYFDLTPRQKALVPVHIAALKMRGMQGINLQYKYPYDFIKAPAKVTLAKMAKMVDQGKLSYGVSLRTAWIVGEENDGSRS